MLSIKPLRSPASVCPLCKEDNDGFSEFLFFGQHILGRGNCAKCGTFYHHNWPVGHGAQFPIAFTNNGKACYAERSALWMAQPLIRSVKNDRSIEVTVDRRINRQISDGFLLNCLDPCFGHIIWKLLNAARYQRYSGNEGLIVLIPRQCIWMVPAWVAEIWAVEVPLSKLQHRLEGLDQFIKGAPLEQLKILPVNTHPDHQKLNLADFFKTKPFDLETFGQRNPTITFIWREDRVWLRSKIEYWFWKAAQKYRIKFLSNWLAYRQKRAMERTADLIQEKLPKAEIAIAGLGTFGTFKKIHDLRQERPDQHWELKWCQQYARSHLVIGTHGSGMLIPTALAGGFLALLPSYKIPFLTEDILMKHAPRYQLFLGRHLDIFSTPSLVARHVVDIFSTFPYLQENTES